MSTQSLVWFCTSNLLLRGDLNSTIGVSRSRRFHWGPDSNTTLLRASADHVEKRLKMFMGQLKNLEGPHKYQPPLENCCEGVNTGVKMRLEKNKAKGML